MDWSRQRIEETNNKKNAASRSLATQSEPAHTLDIVIFVYQNNIQWNLTFPFFRALSGT
jgi:hypothetical protein